MKYINYKKIYILVACILGCVTFSSCSDDDDEVNEWSANYVYLQKDNYLAIDAFKMTHNPMGINGDVTYNFFVKVKSPLTKDLVVDIAATSDEIPVEALSLSSKEITIKAGETSSENVTATISDWSFAMNNKDAKEYNFSLVISEISTHDSSVRISSNQGTKTIKIAKGAYSPVVFTIPDGWKTINRSEWKVSSSDWYDTGNKPQSAIDGDISTSWFTYGTAYDGNGECWFDVVLNTATSLDGFSITRENDYGGYNIQKATIQVKKEGDTAWTTYDTVYEFEAFSNNDPQYAMLDTRIDNVKEFRINVLSPVTFVGVAEFNLYEKK